MWPTYADIIQSENKGWAGSGNERIFYFILDEYKKHKFKDYDLITVQWSGPLRFDYKHEMDGLKLMVLYVLVK